MQTNVTKEGAKATIKLAGRFDFNAHREFRAAYEPLDGRCVGGPCGRGRLAAVAVAEIDGQVYWYPSRYIRPVPFDAPA